MRDSSTAADSGGAACSGRWEATLPPTGAPAAATSTPAPSPVKALLLTMVVLLIRNTYGSLAAVADGSAVEERLALAAPPPPYSQHAKPPPPPPPGLPIGAPPPPPLAPLVLPAVLLSITHAATVSEPLAAATMTPPPEPGWKQARNHGYQIVQRSTAQHCSAMLDVPCGVVPA